MFSRFATALYNAVDALAPPHPLQEDFVWHWKAVTRFYTSKNASSKTPIELTSIPGHLLEMLSILEQEEKEIEMGNIGPCMEYIMQHKLLDTMCILASSDSPTGMKRYMFMFITRVLKIIQQSLIPHVGIYTPIQSFIALCGEVVAGPTENEEMEFLQCLCDIISENPHIVNCFLSDISMSRKQSSTSSDPNNSIENNSNKSENSVKSYSLITSLLRLYKSPDNDISVKARECLKSLCCCANDTAATAIIQFTSLSEILCSSIVTFCKNIPQTIKIHDIENPGDGEENTSKVSPEKRKYLCYLQQLHFIDSLIDKAHPVVSDRISTCFTNEFLFPCLYSRFVESADEDDLIYVTTLIASSLRNISSTKLINAFGVFLLGENHISEQKLLPVQEVLIQRCRDNVKNIALVLCSLQLFEELLLRPTPFILNELILKYLEGRGYHDSTAADSWLQFSDEDVCSRYSDDLSTSSSPTPKDSVPTFINKIIESFLALLPDDIKSCESEEDAGYETYIKEAHNRFMKCLVICEGFDWPQDISEREEGQMPADDDSSSESQPEADSASWTFYEGPFLSMIFDKLELMLQQPYEINLQLTSIISRLALFAHPLLHEYLLNPLIPYSPNTRSLFLVLLKVSEDIQKEVTNIRGFKTKVQLTRNALLSDGNEYATFEESNILEALIILEEFCKELSAIAFVKYHAIS